MTYFPLSVWMTGRSIQKRKEKRKKNQLAPRKTSLRQGERTVEGGLR
jgi:hypothetical protein